MSLQQIKSLRGNGEHEAALRLALELALQSPNNAALQFEVASIHENLGHEAAAIPFYVKAISGGLSEAELPSAYLGLGSYRVLGRYSEALNAFEEGLARFPKAVGLQVFRAMALYNVGRSKEAVESLLLVVAETSIAQDVQSYRRAIEYYAKDLSRVCQDEL